MSKQQRPVGLRHDKNRRAKQRKREKLDALKNTPCRECGKVFPGFMRFVRTDGSVLSGTQSPSANLCQSWGSIMAKVAMCDVVCGFCLPKVR